MTWMERDQTDSVLRMHAAGLVDKDEARKLLGLPKLNDLTEMAWVLIANAYSGIWSKASPKWREAAERWRDAYHATLPDDTDPPIFGDPVR